MELYRCREKLYSMSKAVKFNTAKRSIFSCSFSGLSHTSIHDIFSTVCPASARIPSKRSNRSTQWYNSHWRKKKRKKRIRCLCEYFVTMNCWVWHLDKFTSHLCFSSIPHQYKNPWERLCFEPHGHELLLLARPHTPLDATKPFALSLLRENSGYILRSTNTVTLPFQNPFYLTCSFLVIKEDSFKLKVKILNVPLPQLAKFSSHISFKISLATIHRLKVTNLQIC